MNKLKTYRLSASRLLMVSIEPKKLSGFCDGKTIEKRVRKIKGSNELNLVDLNYMMHHIQVDYEI